MAELSFVRREDRVLILRDEDGRERALPLTDELREVVLREQRSAETPPEELRPREMQAMMRAGATPWEVASLAGVDVERVKRYESPVLAERAWVIQRAQDQAVGHQLDSPSLGELVVNRLATREVDTESLTWDARRAGNEPWQVRVIFQLAGHEAEATWEYDPAARSLRALDDEARWLSETDISSPRSRRHLADVVTSLPNSALAEADKPPAGPKQADTTSLLEDLSALRGQRQPAYDPKDDPDLLDELESDKQTAGAAVIPFTARSVPEPNAPPSAARSAPEEAEETPERKPRGRSGRRSVPSWDEIVFGSKSD